MPRTRSNSNERTLLKSCGLGVCVTVIVTLSLSALAAIFISNEYLQITGMQYIAFLIQLVSVFLGSLLAGKTITERRLLACSAVGGVYFLSLVGLALLFFDGVSGSILYGLIGCVIGCGGALLLCTRVKNRSGSKKRRRRSR